MNSCRAAAAVALAITFCAFLIGCGGGQSSPLSVTTSSPLPGGTLQVPYNAVLQAVGGTQPYAWKVTSGALPAGLTLSGQGAVTGTPAAFGAFDFTAQVTDRAFHSATMNFRIAIEGVVQITTQSPLPQGYASDEYRATLSASGGQPPYNWSLAPGSVLPEGLTLNPSTGVIYGTPTNSGAPATFTVQVGDSEPEPAIASSSFSVTISAHAWTFLNATSVSYNGSYVAGRVNAAVQDPSNPNVVYIATDGARPTGSLGAPDGDPVLGLPDTGGAGVWKTTNWLDAQPQWSALTDGQPSPSIGVHGLVMSPTDSKTLYAVADGPAGCILKTTDAGAHWTALATQEFADVKFGGMAISRADPNTLYAAVFRGSAQTPGGVYKSTDGGSNWRVAGGVIGDVSHVALDPSNPNHIYAGFVDPNNPAQQGVWASTDGGSTWQQQNDNFPADTFSSTLYIEFAFAPSAPQTTYAVVMTPQDKPLPRFYRTPDGGAHWIEICRTSDDPDNRYWHQVLTVNPGNPDLVYAEGLNHQAVYTTNGGLPQGGSCSQVWKDFWTSDDPAGVEFFSDPAAPGGVALAAFGDRGVLEMIKPDTPEESNFRHKQGNLANPLLVTIAVSPIDASTVFGVAVDQLEAMVTFSLTAPYWNYTTVGAEFGKYLITPEQPNIVYNLRSIFDVDASQIVTRSTDGGGAWTEITDGLTNADFPFTRSVETDAAAWKAFEIDPANPRGLLLGATAVYAWSEKRNSWAKISPDLVNPIYPTTSFISALGVTPAAPQQVYVGTSEGTLYLTTDRSNWSPITTLTLPASAFISRIEVDPTNAGMLAVAVQGSTSYGRVWISTTGAASWTDVTGDLPPGLQVYAVAVNWSAGGKRKVFVGTDRGVFYSAFGGSQWSAYGSGLPNTLVDDLRIAPPGTMSAAGYGRGVFQVAVEAR